MSEQPMRHLSDAELTAPVDAKVTAARIKRLKARDSQLQHSIASLLSSHSSNPGSDRSESCTSAASSTSSGSQWRSAAALRRRAKRKNTDGVCVLTDAGKHDGCHQAPTTAGAGELDLQAALQENRSLQDDVDRLAHQLRLAHRQRNWVQELRSELTEARQSLALAEQQLKSQEGQPGQTPPVLTDENTAAVILMEKQLDPVAVDDSPPVSPDISPEKLGKAHRTSPESSAAPTPLETAQDKTRGHKPANLDAALQSQTTLQTNFVRTQCTVGQREIELGQQVEAARAEAAVLRTAVEELRTELRTAMENRIGAAQPKTQHGAPNIVQPKHDLGDVQDEFSREAELAGPMTMWESEVTGRHVDDIAGIKGVHSRAKSEPTAEKRLDANGKPIVVFPDGSYRRRLAAAADTATDPSTDFSRKLVPHAWLLLFLLTSVLCSVVVLLLIVTTT